MNSTEEQVLKSVAVKYGYSGVFYSPRNMSEIHEWINSHPSSDRAGLYTVLGMTCNFYSSLLAEMITDSLKEEE
jgi:hypothetical protein